MDRRWRLPLALALVAAATAGVIFYFNHDTYRDVYMRYADRFRAIRQSYLTVAKEMPPTGQIHETRCLGVPAGRHLFEYSPPPADDRGVGNTDVISAPDLTDFTTAPAYFSLSPGSDLLPLLEATSPSYKPDESDDRWADDQDAKYVDAVSRMRYVVVTRTFDIHRGSARLGTFKGSSMKIEAVIADIHSRKIFCTVSTKAVVKVDELTYFVPEGADEDTERRSQQDAIDEALYTAGESQMEKKLDGLGHGTFSFS